MRFRRSFRPCAPDYRQSEARLRWPRPRQTEPVPEGVRDFLAREDIETPNTRTRPPYWTNSTRKGLCPTTQARRPAPLQTEARLCDAAPNSANRKASPQGEDAAVQPVPNQMLPWPER